jgi:hypothetical protein
MTPLLILNAIIGLFATIIYYRSGNLFLIIVWVPILIYSLARYERWSNGDVSRDRDGYVPRPLRFEPAIKPRSTAAAATVKPAATAKATRTAKAARAAKPARSTRSTKSK